MRWSTRCLRHNGISRAVMGYRMRIGWDLMGSDGITANWIGNSFPIRLVGLPQRWLGQRRGKLGVTPWKSRRDPVENRGSSQHEKLRNCSASFKAVRPQVIYLLAFWGAMKWRNCLLLNRAKGSKSMRAMCCPLPVARGSGSQTKLYIPLRHFPAGTPSF